METTSSALAAARALGAQHGQEVASWTFDGNTELGTYRKCLDLDEEGDPAWDAIFGTANPMSKESPDSWAPEDVLAHLDTDTTGQEEEALDAYTDSFFASYREAVLATARKMVA